MSRKNILGVIVMLILVCAAILMLASCKGNEPDASRPTAAPTDNAAETQTAENTDQAQPTESDKGGDFDNAFRELNGVCIMETDEVYYYHSISSAFIYYSEKDTNDYGVLCGRPECVHDEIIPNWECDGFAPIDYMGLTMYDGKIWYVGSDPDKNNRQSVLFKMNQDGTDRTLVRVVAPYELKAGFQNTYIHRGKLILTGHTSSVENAVPYEEVSLWYCGIKSGELKKAVAVKDSDRGHVIKVCFRNESVYVLITSTDYDNYDSTVDIFRINLDTEETETLYHAEALDMGMGDIWVSEDGTVYTTTAGDERFKPIGLYKLEGGELSLVYDFSEDDVNATDAYIFDKYVISFYIRDMAQKHKEILFIIKDREGNTVYNGEIPKKSVDSLGLDIVDYYYYPVACRGDSILVPIICEMETGRSPVAVVRYDVTPEGLEETLIGVMKWG